MNKYLYEKALGYYTSNANEIVNDIVDNNDWSNIEIWKPFENWSIEDVKELVDTLYEDFLEVQNGNEVEKSFFPTKEDIIQVGKGLGIEVTESQIEYVLEGYEDQLERDPNANWDLIVDYLLDEYSTNMTYRYFDVYVFYDKKNGFSSFIKIPNNMLGEYGIEEDVHSFAIKNNHLDEEDLNYIVHTREIDKQEYKQALNIKD